MVMNKALLGLCCAVLLGLGACSRQQSDWEKTRATNTTDAYEQFLKKYPSGEFTAQAQARVRELYEEHDWQKARDTDTQEAYQAFLKQYPEGKWTEEARIRVENFTLGQAPSGSTAGTQPVAPAPAAPATHAAPAPSQPPASPGPKAVAPGAKAATPGAKAATAPRAEGSFGIQLGAFKSNAAAVNHQAGLEKKYPKLLAGLTPKVAPKKTASGTLFRLQVAGLSEKQAREICRSLKAKAEPCVPIKGETRHH